MTNPALAKKIELVQKMLNQASCPGATAAESEAFMGKAQEWIEKYNITQAMLYAESEAPVSDEPILKKTVYERTKVDNYGNVTKAGKMPTWMLTLASGAAYANRCRHWYSSSRYHANVSAAGTEANLQTFELIMPFLVSEVNRLYKEEKPTWLGRGEGKRWATSFRNGCASRIAARLREARRNVAEAMKAEAGMSHADRYRIAMEANDTDAILALDKEGPKKQEFGLACVETALAKLDNDETRAKDWVKDNMKFRKGNARNHYGSNTSAYHAGHKAGSRANINAPKGRIG